MNLLTARAPRSLRAFDPGAVSAALIFLPGALGAREFGSAGQVGSAGRVMRRMQSVISLMPSESVSAQSPCHEATASSFDVCNWHCCLCRGASRVCAQHHGDKPERHPPWECGGRPDQRKILIGGSGADYVDGGQGADRLLLRDGMRDTAVCRAGRDTVLADQEDRVLADCENVQRPARPSPPTPPPPPALLLHHRRSPSLLARTRACWRATSSSSTCFRTGPSRASGLTTYERTATSRAGSSTGPLPCWAATRLGPTAASRPREAETHALAMSLRST